MAVTSVVVVVVEAEEVAEYFPALLVSIWIGIGLILKKYPSSAVF